MEEGKRNQSDYNYFSDVNASDFKLNLSDDMLLIMKTHLNEKGVHTSLFRKIAKLAAMFNDH